ncbi:helix-turn-helix domain-containing protein [Enterococcus avium]|uniref:helix-turn-helix domain-containing protein n=1 Tax=Enterococcus avium TaxID=33945 RepID=UPI003BF52C54
MTIFERIKKLADKQGKSINDVENDLGYSKNTLYRLKKNKPGAEKLEELADYFDVSIDYLLGRTDKKRYYDLTEKDEKDIAKELEEMIADLKSTGALAYSKDSTEVDEETRRLLIISLENSLRIAKIEAKKKFTPKKYRD